MLPVFDKVAPPAVGRRLQYNFSTQTPIEYPVAKFMKTIAVSFHPGLLLALYLAGVAILFPAPAGGSDLQKIYAVKAFGAKGDGKSFDTLAIQSAIDQAGKSGGGKVVLTPGTYLSGSLHLKSHVEFIIEKDATLLGSAMRSDYVRGDRFALLLADGQEDLTVSGAGTINGQGRALARDVAQRVATGEVTSPLKPSGSPNENERPSIIEFRNCHHAKVTGITVRDAACWTQIYANCEDLVIDGMQVDSAVCENNDGIDIVDCRRVQMRHCDIRSEDDGICLKSETGGSGCDDVEVSDCRVCSLVENGFKLGTSGKGGFRKIHAKNLTMDNTRRSAIALESVDGGVLEDVLVENVHGTNVGDAIFLRLGHRNKHGPVGHLRNIVIRNVRVEVLPNKTRVMAILLGQEPDSNPSKAPDENVCPSSIVGLPGHPVQNVRLENIEIIYPGGGVPRRRSVLLGQLDAVPELPAQYPEFWMFGELPAWGFYCRHAEGIKFDNVTLRVQSHDFRPALVCDDVRNVELNRFHADSTGSGPAIVLKDVQGAAIHNSPAPLGAGGFIKTLGSTRDVQGESNQ